MPLRIGCRVALLSIGLLGGFWAPTERALAQSLDTDAGAYLAANAAFDAKNFEEAAAWYARALISHPENLGLIERLSVSHLALGEVKAAAIAARKVQERGSLGQVLHLALLADAAMQSDYDAILADPGVDVAVDRLITGLVQGWASFGKGQVSEALKSFDDLAKIQGFKAFALYHKSLVMALAGDLEGAEAILSGKSGELELSARDIFARVQILSQLERNADAIAVLTEAFGNNADPQLLDLSRRLAAGEPLDLTIARNAKEGMAEAFFSLADALSVEEDKAYALVFAQSAIALRPDHVDALLLAGEMFEQLEQYSKASDLYGRVPETSPQRLNARIAASLAAERSGDQAASVELLKQLAAEAPDSLVAQISYADALRRAEDCETSVTGYDRVFETFGADALGWSFYFNRGVCHEKLQDMPRFEADMRKSLELQPNQPQVLNYLGYSLVDRGMKLDEALSLIEAAVLAEPESGYIIDSLAWALYRLGRYQDALPYMERASLLEPVDPIVTDHLGDIYWAVGRRREAEFQWHRALSFDPVEKDAIRIRAKLAKGLDAVLKDEGGRALTPVDDAKNGD